jgi:cellulose synthase/poly-beta-1,6-N-acetylglucosamine synthase-like glycosyltransferase
MSSNITTATKRMLRFSQLAGPLQPRPAKSDAYSVKFLSVADKDQLVYRMWARVLAVGSLLIVTILTAILLQPAHWVALAQPKSPVRFENWIMLLALVILQIFLIIGTASTVHASWKAKDPVPTRAPRGLRVALVTTRAPGEPVEMVRATLTAAKQVRRAGGSVDVWLLDETNDIALHYLCFELGVKYFCRKNVKNWNTLPATWRRFKKIEGGDPRFAAKTKHGNYNAWGVHLDKYKYRYDIIAGVDTDQAPQPNFLERLLGYFNDPDVAYVVGPQVYSNYAPGLNGLVTRWAESQASFFQSTIQRAANDSNSAMFVGTNYAVRTVALAQIGGFYPCITEDMATGMAIHASVNKKTGNHWKSVYTPDVLALGEGPRYWTTYFSQQWRWAAGAFDTWHRLAFKMFKQIDKKARLHYFLILTYYPIAALTWLLGMVSSMLYLFTGASAIKVAWNQFITLYLMATVLQLSMYFWNRRYNVSPHEPEGSYGVAGMMISTLTAPVYLLALITTVIGKKASFVVTKKGDGENPDWIKAFSVHLKWGALIVAGLVFGVMHGNTNPAMLVWVGVQLAVCLLPFVLGMSLAVPIRLRATRAKLAQLTFGKPLAEAQNA